MAFKKPLNPLLPHPPGSSFIRIDDWILDSLGVKEHCAAACLDRLEFWQRINYREAGDGGFIFDWVQASADDFSASLDRMFACEKVRQGLNLLVQKGLILEKMDSVLEDNLWRRYKYYKLNLSVISEIAKKWGSEKTNLKHSDPENRVPANAKTGTPEARKTAPPKHGKPRIYIDSFNIENTSIDNFRCKEEKTKKPVQGSRLAADWTLPDEWAEWTKEKKPLWLVDDLTDVESNFRDYWISCAGPKALKIDWQMTWKRWVNNEPDLFRK